MNARDVTETIKEAAESKSVIALNRFLTPILLIFLAFLLKANSDEASKKADTVAAQISGMTGTIQDLSTSVGQIQTTIAEGLRKTLSSQGQRIEALEKRTDKLADDQQTLRLMLYERLGEPKGKGD